MCKEGVGPSSLVTSDRMQGIGLKSHQGRCRLDIKKNFFTERVAKCWNRLGCCHGFGWNRVNFLCSCCVLDF